MRRLRASTRFRRNRAARVCLLVGGLVLGLSRSGAAEEEYLGAERCSSCHPKQYAQWKRSGHALSLVRLSEAQKKDRGCRSCHTMLVDRPEPEFAAVQCESCHGPGSFYSAEHVMKDKKLATLMGLKPVDEKTCQSCHGPSDGPSVRPFDFEKRLKQVKCVSSNPGSDEK